MANSLADINPKAFFDLFTTELKNVLVFTHLETVFGKVCQV